jgi:hypothetical protein
MGCDIHCYIQYKKKTDEDNWWECFGGEIWPGRNYAMFGILAGVRDHYAPHSFTPKGILPEEKQSWAVRDDLYLVITEDGKGHNETTLENAKLWSSESELIKDKDGKPVRILQPDWHNHSWMTIEELEKAYKLYKKYIKSEGEEGRIPFGFKMILKVMKALEDNGKNDVLLVFWFDN